MQVVQVRDKTVALGVPRIHEIPTSDGLVTAFTFVDKNQFQPIDYAVAMRYFHPYPEAFEVRDSDNRVIPPSRPEPVAGTSIILPPDQCIAHLDELTALALVARCHKLPGGHVIKAGTKKADLIGFIMAGGDKLAEDTAEEGVDLEDDGEGTVEAVDLKKL